jgi:hypothetical protein
VGEAPVGAAEWVERLAEGDVEGRSQADGFEDLPGRPARSDASQPSTPVSRVSMGWKNSRLTL